jgi:hypothetical protein
MRIKITETKVFPFEELTDEQKDKVFNNYFDINVDLNWWDSTYEDAEQIGLKLTSFDIDRASYCNGDFLLSANEVAQNIFNNHGEHCETYKTAELFMEKWQPVFNAYMDETSEKYESAESESLLMELEDDFKKSLLEDYRIILTHEYEYLTSREAILETLRANEYEFTEDGKIA